MKTGFVCGVFDLFHAGHVRMLSECKAHCDHLIVALNRAENLPAGKNIPIFSIEERIELMESCKLVDEVLTYNSEEELTALLRKLRPNVRFLGTDYRDKPITGRELSDEIYFTDRSHGKSTSGYIARILKRYEERKPLSAPVIELNATDLIPLYDFRASAGIRPTFADAAFPEPADHLLLPDMKDSDGAVRITGDSMYPVLSDGDTIVYKLLNDKLSLSFGNMYLLYISHEGEELFFVKYVERSEREGYLRLTSENPLFAPVEFPVDSIRRVAAIKASIRLER